MIINQNDLDNFHNFATHLLATSAGELSLNDLLSQWQATREEAETVESVRRGVADADAGRLHDLTDVDAMIRATLGFPARGK